MMKKIDNIDRLIILNFKKKSPQVVQIIFKELGIELSSDAVRQRKSRLMKRFSNLEEMKNALQTPIEEKPVEYQVEDDRTIRKLKQTKSTTDKKYKEILQRVDDLESLLEATKQIKEVSTFEIQPKKHNGGSQAWAVLVASDWHLEEPVLPETVDMLNEYNLGIAEKRATQFFQSAHRLLTIFDRDIKIEGVVLALLGDFISGTIHDDLMETNLLSPIDAILFAEKLLASGIQFLLDNTDYDFVIPCHSGNHGRMTKKQRIASEHGNSLERYMYHTLAIHFKNEPRVKFMISAGYHSFVKIYDYTIRFHHGHNIRYGGGVGGVTIPVNKAIAQWNKGRKVDLDVFGHFHQAFDGGNFILNGSMIGWNTFGVSIKGSYEKPKQYFFLIDKKRGKTVTCPIIFDI